MKNLKLKFYTDPGHCWLAVKRQVCCDMGIIGEISNYSYERGETVYLEEDCDAALLLRKLESLNIRYDATDTHTKGDRMSPIRSYDHFEERPSDQT